MEKNPSTLYFIRQKYFKLNLQNGFFASKANLISNSCFTSEFKTLVICMQILLKAATHEAKF